ncbi:hypothetical protein [Actinoplanes sp. M2I2]|uniref:hypothetical protein n=1 Tax=Actinoplanes sp. M2I2 TaxID=1734444 RepID=UPI00201FD888|nr:hypothetical protein [Actinoplanes sp. M2I2]
MAGTGTADIETSRSPLRGTLFSAADRQIEGLLTQARFDTSLIEGLLFLDGGLIIPDIYFFISARLKSHLDSAAFSRLEAALEMGMVQPSFRSQETASFVDSLQVVRRAGIAGLLPGDQPDQIARRLDAALQRAADYQPAFWPSESPTSVAEHYQEIVESCLTGDEPPPVESGKAKAFLEDVWRRSVQWRIDCLQRAVTASGSGLRRGALMKEIGRTVGIEGSVDDVRDLYKAARAFGLAEEDVNALKTICTIMNNCYLYNQAQQQVTRADFPAYDQSAEVVLTAGRLTDEAIRAGSTPRSERPRLERTVTAPSMDALMEADPRRLLGVRKDIHAEYLAAVRAWRREPSSQQAERLVDIEHAYVETLTRNVPEHLPDQMTITHIAGSGSEPSTMFVAGTATTPGGYEDTGGPGPESMMPEASSSYRSHRAPHAGAIPVAIEVHREAVVAPTS